MKIEQFHITVRDLVEGYVDNAEEGVKGFAGKLDIRPPFQREFVYNEKQRNAVIQTIYDGYPLNVMYWAKRDDGTFEIIDGQQRTVSICQYWKGNFATLDTQFFKNLLPEVQERILDYPLMIYVCEGTAEEKLAWFRTINIAGEKLTDQELRNAVYSGMWLSDAKRYFSKTRCPAYMLGGDIVAGSPIRQELLETALKWICARDGVRDIELYMAQHQHDPNALKLWEYFQTVVSWANNYFDKKHKSIMKGLKWAELYEKHHHKVLDKTALDNDISRLLRDSDVENKKGIIPYLLDRDERHLQLRAFGDDIRQSVYDQQKGICPSCGEHFELCDMEADHIVPWCRGGKTVEANCQMLCMPCNRKKSGK